MLLRICGPRRSRLKFFFPFSVSLVCFAVVLFFLHIDSTQTINVVCFCLRACFTFYFASIDFLFRSLSLSLKCSLATPNQLHSITIKFLLFTLCVQVCLARELEPAHAAAHHKLLSNDNTYLYHFAS